MMRKNRLKLAIASAALAIPGMASAGIVSVTPENTYTSAELLSGWTSNHQTDTIASGGQNGIVLDRWQLPSAGGGLLSLGLDGKNWISVSIYYGTAAGYEDAATGIGDPNGRLATFGPSNNNFNGQEFALINAVIPSGYTHLWFVGTAKVQTGNGGDGYKGVGDVNFAPVPEPSTWAMLLAGLGMLGFMARRRAKQA